MATSESILVRGSTAAIDSEPRGSLLVVDDSEANRDALSRHLKRLGYLVTGAEDGQQALDWLARQQFDLVLLDVMMPEIDGLEVLRRVRQTHPPEILPIIMATANDASGDVVRALNLGANDYVTKPLDFPVVAARVRTQLELRRSVERIRQLQERLGERARELEAAHRDLVSSNQRLHRDLRAAAKVQEALLPRASVALPGFEFAWAFEPCEELAGDALNICPLAADQASVYLLDVSGHGVAAALLAVRVAQLLAPLSAGGLGLGRGAEVEAAVPADVARLLSQHFPWQDETEQFFTILYGVADVARREFRYVSAGHPPPVLIRRAGEPELLPLSGGLPIGLAADYECVAVPLASGDRLYIYSDGVTEAMGLDGELFGESRMLRSLAPSAQGGLRASVDSLLADLRRWRGETPPHDDLSVIALEANW